MIRIVNFVFFESTLLEDNGVLKLVFRIVQQLTDVVETVIFSKIRVRAGHLAPKSYIPLEGRTPDQCGRYISKVPCYTLDTDPWTWLSFIGL